jgi:hypothetical protein
VIDYEILSTTTNFTFKGDTTYFVNGQVALSGTTTIEGGTVVKFRNNGTAQIDIQGPIVCLTEPNLPAIFTADADDVFGQRENFYAVNTPSGKYAEIALNISSSSNTLQHLHIHHAKKAFDFNTTASQQLRHIQITRSGIGIQAAMSYPLQNALLWSNGTNFSGGAYTSRCEQVTIHQSSLLAYSTNTNSALTFTNCLLVSVTNLGTVAYSTNCTVTLTNDTGVFLTVGAGAHYLPTNSPYLNLGTMAVDPTLLAEIHQRTVFAPTVYSNVTFSTNQAFSAGSRDQYAPDLGYHYTPMDYVFGGAVFSGCTITLTNGAVAGTFDKGDYYDGYGIRLTAGAAMRSIGSITNVVKWVRYTTTQEGASTVWHKRGWGGMLSHYAASGGYCIIEGRFLKSYMMSEGPNHFWGGNWNNNTSLIMRDCEFNRGNFYSTGPTFAFTNCLFNRVYFNVEAYAAVSLELANNLHHQGLFTLSGSAGGSVWNVKDCFFYGGTVTNTSTAATRNFDYNGFVTNQMRLTPQGANDVIVSNFTWQTGALGRFYYPTNLAVINAGSLSSAGLRGLFHYTTTTNQAKDAATILDIGFHYIAYGTNSLPVDSDGEGLPDYIEDVDGDGTVDSGETSYILADTDGDGISDYIELLIGSNPLIANQTDPNNTSQLLVFPPLK